MTIEKIKYSSSFVAHCDSCPEYIEVESEDFRDVIQELKKQGWKFHKDEKGKWTHKCIICQERGI